MSDKKGKFSIFAVWRKLAGITRKNPVILTPFLWIAFFDALLLLVLFLAPRFPFSPVLAPIVRAFWGERFLHYPANFLVLPRFFYTMRLFLGVIIGSFLTGVAVSLIHQSEEGDVPLWWFGIRKAVSMYIRLIIIWGILLAVYFLTVKIFTFLDPFLISRKIIYGKNFLLGVSIQMLFIFTIPAIIIENKKIPGAIIRSLAFVKNFPVTIFIFIAIPSIMLVPMDYLQIKLPVLMGRFFPEVTLYVLGGKIFVITIIDFVITASATVLLLLQRKVEAGGVSD